MNFKAHDPQTQAALEWLEARADEQSGGGWISREDAMRLVALIELLAAPRRDHFAVSVFDPSYERLTPKTDWPDVWDRFELTPDDPEPEQRVLDLRPAFQSDMDNVTPPPADLKAVMTTTPYWVHPEHPERGLVPKTPEDHRRWFPWRYQKPPPVVLFDCLDAMGGRVADPVTAALPDHLFAMTEKARGSTRAQLHQAGWRDAELLRHGLMVTVPAVPASSVDHASHRHYAPDERRPPARGGLYNEPRGDDLAMSELNDAIKRGDVE